MSFFSRLWDDSVFEPAPWMRGWNRGWESAMSDVTSTLHTLRRQYEQGHLTLDEYHAALLKVEKDNQV